MRKDFFKDFKEFFNYFFKGFSVYAPEPPPKYLARRSMWVWFLGSGSFLSPWRGSRRSRFLNPFPDRVSSKETLIWYASLTTP